MGAQLGLVQRAPLAAGPQDEEDGIRTGAIWHAWASAAKAMRIHLNWEQRLKYGLEFVGNAKVGRRMIVR